MAADPATLKRIRSCPFARGRRVLVRFRANGYSLFARRSREPLVRLTGEGDNVVLLYPSHRDGGENLGGFRGSRYAARPRPPEPQLQSILPGASADLRVNAVRASMTERNSVPCKLQLTCINTSSSGLCFSQCITSHGHSRQNISTARLALWAAGVGSVILLRWQTSLSIIAHSR